MAQVYDVKVRFMQRIQIREYEPAESEVTISAQMGDDDDLMSVGQELITNARDLVKSALTGKTTGTSTGKTKTKVTKKTVVDEIPEGDDEIPGDEGPSPEELKKVAAVEKRKLAAEKRKAKKLVEKEAADKKAAEEDEIPGDDDGEIPGDDEEDSGKVTVEELASFINTMVTSRQVKPKQIKAVLAKYDASRISEVPAEDCVKAKAAIQKLADD